VARWFRFGLSVAGSFVCRCLTSPTMLPFPLPAHRTGRADFPHPALGLDSPPSPRCKSVHLRSTVKLLPEPLIVIEVARPKGQSLDPYSFRQHSRTEAPSLHRRYPASSVVRASPPPHTAEPVPRGRLVGGHTPPPLGLPVFRALSLYRHAIATTPAEPWRSCRSILSTTAAFPKFWLGRLPHYPFRGLLGVHSRYGLPAR